MVGPWHEIRNHPVASLLFFVLWVVVWAVTVAAWETDAAGHSVGMSSAAVPLHLLLPLVLGALVGWWWRSTPRSLGRVCAFAGLAFSALHVVALLMVGLVWIPQVESVPETSETVAGTLVFAVVYAAISIVLGMIGGTMGRSLSAGLHRHRVAGS